MITTRIARYFSELLGMASPAQLGNGAASASTFLRGDSNWAAPPPGIGIGVDISGGSPNQVLYADANNKVAQSVNLVFNGPDLSIGGKVTTTGVVLPGYNWRVSSSDPNWGMWLLNIGATYQTRICYIANGSNDFSAGFFDVSGSQYVAWVDTYSNFNVAKDINVSNNANVSGKVNIPGIHNDYSFQIADFGIGYNGTNNYIIADNIYYDGSGYSYKHNGYGNAIYFYNGAIGISQAVQNLAGANASATMIQTFDIKPSGATFSVPVDITGNLNVSNNVTAPRFVTPGSTTNLDFQAGSIGLQGYGTNNSWIMENCHYNGSNFIYNSNGYASQIGLYGGVMALAIAGSGTAGAVVSLDSCFSVDSAGNTQVKGDIAANQFFTKGSSGNFTCVNRTTGVNAWQMASQNGELTFWDYTNNATAAYFTQTSHELHLGGRLVSDFYGGADFNIQAGSMGLQYYGTNNCWLSDNLFFDGFGWRYKHNGYGVLIYFTAGQIQFVSADQNSAGDNISAPIGEIFTISSIGATSTGTIATGSSITGSRPAGTRVGAQWYDTTLNKPIWWDGSAWRDAMSNVV